VVDEKIGHGSPALELTHRCRGEKESATTTVQEGYRREVKDKDKLIEEIDPPGEWSATTSL